MFKWLFSKKHVEEKKESPDDKLMTLAFVMENGNVKTIINVDTESFEKFCDNNNGNYWTSFTDISINMDKVQYYFIADEYTRANKKEPVKAVGK